MALVVATPAHADEVVRWWSYIGEASARFGVPPTWIERVMLRESGGRTEFAGRPIRSPKGAIGLMQLMPATWASIRAVLGLGNDPDDPRDNIFAGTYYLRLMYDRFGYPGCFAAYNAGPGRYAAWLAGSASLPRETVAYLGAVNGLPVAPARIDTPASPPPSLFAVQREPAAATVPDPARTSATILFAVRKVSP
nr:lytic transglycosylase domain-containing protein [Sphingomonas asaccharolytica]